MAEEEDDTRGLRSVNCRLDRSPVLGMMNVPLRSFCRAILNQHTSLLRLDLATAERTLLLERPRFGSQERADVPAVVESLPGAVAELIVTASAPLSRMRCPGQTSSTQSEDED